MKKLLLFLTLFFPSLVFAQSTIVSGNVIDAGGQVWFQGSVVFTFVPPGGAGNAQFTWSGGPFNPGQAIAAPLDVNGHYSVSIPSNTAIVPANSKWTVTANSGTTSLTTGTTTLTITGATQTVNFTPPALALTANFSSVAYSDVEVAAQPGQTYFNLTSRTIRQCNVSTGANCTNWSNSPLLLTNTPLAFSATPSFNASTSASYSMTLTGNVTSSTITGNPVNGNLLSLTLTEDGAGLHSFAFPANFVFTPGFSFNTAALAINELTFKFDGTNWHLISNSGGTGGGGTPAGATGNIQINSSGVFGVGGENDNGSIFSTTRDSQFCGPNPYVDVRCFGARPLSALFSTTGSITSGSPNLTLNVASNFINGDGITITGAGATPTITTPAAPTVVAADASTLPGTGLTVANSSGATTYQYQIVAIDALGGATIASAATSIATGAATLGSNTVNVASWTRANNIVTVTTAAPHNIVQFAMVSIGTDANIAGTWQVATVPDNTHFTFQTAQDTRNGAVTSGGSNGIVTYYTCNHITWAAVTGAWKYLIYGRAAGNMALIGVSLPENTGNIHSDPLYNDFDDFGSVMSAAPTGLPAWYPATPPVAVKNQDLTTTIVSGAGTVNVVLAANAGNTVAGATATFDNAPNILAAARVAAGVTGTTPGVLFIPQNPGASYFTSSVLNIAFFPQTLSVQQAGSLVLLDTMILGASSWVGFPKIANSAGSFPFERLPQLSVSGNPGIYTNNAQTNMSYIALTAPSGNQALLYLDDLGGGIPGPRWENMTISTAGSNDCLGRDLIIRNNISGGANMGLKYVSFGAGTCAVVSNAPLFQHTQNGGNPWSLDHIFLNRRGMYWGGGFQGTVDSVYEQGAVMPKFTFANTLGGSVGVAMDLRSSIEDTTLSTIITYFPGISGYIRFIGSNGISGFPLTNGPGGMIFSFEVVGTPNGLLNANMFSKITTGGTAVDGTINLGSGSNVYPEEINNMAVAVGAPYKVFASSVAQAPPTCVVSAGGTVPIGVQGPFTVAPVFPDNGEGVISPPSPTCTTSSGQQTITISWTAVPGAIGYDLYKNGFSFQCSPPFVNGTFFVWSGQAACGQSQSLLAGSGPVSLSSNGIITPQIKLTATNGGGIDILTMPTATAVRSQNFPDANGTILLDSASGTPSAYDNFNRANGAVGSNWTACCGGTFNVAGNQYQAASSGNIGTFWNANTYSPDQFSEITIGTVGQMGAAVRMSGGGNYYACLELAGALVIQKLVGGAFTNLTSSVVTPVTGDILRADVVGQSPATINCWRNGVIALTATDSSLTAGQPGIYTANATGTGDNWSGGNIHPLAKLDTEQDWTQPQHFTTAITVGNPAPIPGALAVGTLYASTAQLSNLTASQPVCTDLNKNLITAGCTSNIWSNLGNAIANLTLSNAGFNTTFNQTSSSVNWTWANITAATNVASQSTPVTNYCGTYWTGAVSAADCWLIQGVVGNGTNGTSVLTFTHAGTSGTVSESFPGAASFGTTPINCGAAVTGCISLNEAATAGGNTNTDTIRGDSVNHRLMVNENGVVEMALTRTFNVNVTPVTANANVTTDQNLMAATVPANLLNVVGRTLRINIAGVYSTAASSTAALTFKIKLCTVSGCGSGTVLNLEAISTPALATVSASNKTFNLFAYSTTQTGGATSAYEVHGNLTVDLNTTTGQPVATLPDNNVTTVGTIDCTVQTFIQVTGAASIASVSNSFTQRQMTIEVLN